MAARHPVLPDGRARVGDFGNDERGEQQA